MLNRLASLTTVFLLVFSLAACEGGEDNAATSGGEINGMLAPDAEGTVVLQPEGNQMAYATTEFAVRPGQEVRLVFENTATAAAMSHNVVILDGTDEEMVNRVGQGGLQAGPENEYVPEDEAIIAYTPMADPAEQGEDVGETVEVTFTAPEEPGEYRFICTFPGHYQLMQGTMHVVAE